MSYQGTVRLTSPDDVSLTVTITMPVHGWKRARDREYYAPFHMLVGEALAKVAGLSTDTEIEP